MNELIFIRKVDPYISPAGYKKAKGLYKCFCGNEFETLIDHVRSGNTTSCGCFHNAELSKRAKTHGLSDSPTYRSWNAMINRCTNEKSEHYDEYGAVGITVCERWLSFDLFISDMGIRPGLNYSIDRWPNKTGNYEPGNSRWATRKQQSRNKVNSNVVLFNGEMTHVADVAEALGIRHVFVLYHHKKGRSIDEIVERFRKNKSKHA
jgi:hypothetical protein